MSQFTVNALNSALAGLSVSQQLLDLTSQNISNASTPGYTRKTLQTYDQLASGQVVGVQTGVVQRNVNENLQRAVRNQNSVSSNLSTLNTALSKIQALYGTADAQTNFSSALTNLHDDFTSLSGTPSSTTLQQQTVQDAQTFANAVNNTAQTLTQLRNNAQSDIGQTVTAINGQLQTIAQLNVQIAQLQAINQSTADLSDQRDNAIDSLSKEIGVSTYARADGVVVVQTSQGQTLADTQAQTLLFTQQSIGSTIAYPATLTGVTIGSTTGFDLAANPGATGGTLGADLQLRDQILPQQQAQLDELSEQTANRFNAQGVKLFTDSSGNIPANTPTAYAGFSSLITVNPAVAANPALIQQGTTPVVPPAVALQAGDNTIVNKVLDFTFGLNSATGTPNTPFNTTGLGVAGNISLTSVLPTVSTLENFAQQALASQASQASNTTQQNTNAGNYLTSLQTSLSNQSAVNLDTEVANLTVYENSYSTAAQVISTLQKLMAELLDAVK